MKKILTIVLFSIIFSINAQVKFEKGYIITNEDIKEEVIIKNLDRSESPKSFTYKTDEKSSDLIGTPNNIKEFAIYGAAKYITYSGPVDVSPENISSLSHKYEPELQNETFFLKVIASGDKNLYSYTSKNTTKYFYSESGMPIEPLIYKKYNPEGDQLKVATNNSYISQLRSIFKNDPGVLEQISSIKYNENSLTKIFNLHNQKISPDTNNEFQSEENTSKFNLSIRPGINFYSPVKTDELLGAEFPSKTNFRIGVETEVVLPYNKNKWAILLEPTYSAYSNKEIIAPSSDNLYALHLESYSFINIPVGLRYYMYLNNKSKFFINANVNVLNLRLGKAKSLDLSYNGNTFNKADLATSSAFKSFSFGAGYNYSSKFSIEARYNSQINIIDETSSQRANISYTSIILGYNIF